MKMLIPIAASLLIAGPAAAQPSHSAHHPAGKPPATAISDDKGCPKMEEMSAHMDQMKQMHEQMMGQMAQMMQMMQSMQSMQQHQGMGMAMPKSTPPTDDKPH